MKYSDLSSRSRLRSTWLKFASASLMALAVAGCGGGSDGAAGPQGPQGPQGPVSTVPGPVGPDLVNVVKVAELTSDQWISMKWSAQITSAKVGADGKPIVNFKVSDEKGNPITGLAYPSYNAITGTAIAPAYANFGFTFAKLVPADANLPSHWVSYIVTATPTYKTAADHSATNIIPATPRAPTTDNQGTMVDNGGGSYTYTFYRDITATKAVVDGGTYDATKNQLKADLGDTSYVPALTHRVAMQLQGTMPGTGTNTPDAITVKATVASTNPVAAFYDFVPAGGAVTTARTITSVDKCQSCHAGALVHGRKDPNLCVTCHTSQATYGYKVIADVNGTYPAGSDNADWTMDGTSKFSNVDFPRWIHKIHMGSGLVKQNYNIRGVTVNEVEYPQDQRNCAKCHTSSTTTPQGDNWKANPSRLACGSCHDGIDFSTGGGTRLNGQAGGHLAGKGYADDAKCSTCHEAADIDAYHVPVTPMNAATALTGATVASVGQTNVASIAAYSQHLPVGAKAITYDISAASVDATTKKVSVTFRILQNGARADFNTFGAGKTELWENFIGSPSVYVAFNTTQDGIAAPADFNATYSGYLKNIWNGTQTGTGASTLAGPDANGYYTVTMTGVAIPAASTMVVAGLGYTYTPSSTLPFTQTNLLKYPYSATTQFGGLIVAAPNAWKVAKGSSRRILVENARCNTCHEKLGVFKEEAYHAGQRNDAQTCNFCHNPNKTSSGWAVASSTFVHAIHAGGTTSTNSTTGNINQPVAGLVASSKGLTNKRTVLYSWENNLAAGIGYPGGIKNCQACHLPDVVNFGTQYTRTSSSDLTPISSSVASVTSGSGYLPFVDNLLNSTAAYNNIAAAGAVPGSLSNVAGTTVLSPYVVAGADYGTSPTAVTALGAVTVNANNLVTTPISAACFSCHDTAKAKTHMTDNHGLFYVTRTVANAAAKENCLTCHGAGKAADAQAVHQ